MNRFNFLIVTAVSIMCFSGFATASPTAEDHNSTRSNRGTVVAPANTDGAIVKKPVSQMQDAAQPVKGRNPQTGKEINIAAEQVQRTGRNPQTGKEINRAVKKKGK